MGTRIVVAEGEPIALALRRLKESLRRNRTTMYPARLCWFIKPTQHRRAKKFKKRFKARKQTLIAQISGEQPLANKSKPLGKNFWRKTGKP